MCLDARRLGRKGNKTIHPLETSKNLGFEGDVSARGIISFATPSCRTCVIRSQKGYEIARTRTAEKSREYTSVSAKFSRDRAETATFRKNLYVASDRSREKRAATHVCFPPRRRIVILFARNGSRAIVSVEFCGRPAQLRDPL